MLNLTFVGVSRFVICISHFVLALNDGTMLCHFLDSDDSQNVSDVLASCFDFSVGTASGTTGTGAGAGGGTGNGASTGNGTSAARPHGHAKLRGARHSKPWADRRRAAAPATGILSRH
jgi:hypothetical protein